MFTDLSATLLMRHDQVALYAQESQVQSACSVSSPAVVSPPSSVPLAWDGRLWVIEALGELVQLRPEIGEPLTLPLAEFEYLQQAGAMWVVSETSPSPSTPQIRQLLERASPKAQHEANERLRHMLAYSRGEPTTASRRSVQRWWNAYQAAEAESGCGYLARWKRLRYFISNVPNASP